MLLPSATPTFHEWVALIQQDSTQAKQLLVSLQAQLKKQGLMADPGLDISIEDYEKAQNLLSAALSDPRRAERIAYITRFGEALLGPYPDREDWLRLIREDPNFAQELCFALQTKQVLLGLHTPQDLLKSIEIYSLVNRQE
jgi:hypothetical protein